jgi:regulatory protein
MSVEDGRRRGRARRRPGEVPDHPEGGSQPGRPAEIAGSRIPPREDGLQAGRPAGIADGGIRPPDEGLRAGRPGGMTGGRIRSPEDPPGDPDSVARLICLRLLTSQPRTRAELAAALARRGVPEDAAGRVLERFAEVGLIDDEAFASAWVDSRHAGRGLGRRALSRELRQRGVDGRVAAEAVAALDPDTELATARALVRRRLPSTARLEPPVRVRRLTGLLARKGYPAAIALRVVREELATAGDAAGGELAADDVSTAMLDADEDPGG